MWRGAIGVNRASGGDYPAYSLRAIGGESEGDANKTYRVT